MSPVSPLLLSAALIIASRRDARRARRGSYRQNPRRGAATSRRDRRPPADTRQLEAKEDDLQTVTDHVRASRAAAGLRYLWVNRLYAMGRQRKPEDESTGRCESRLER